MYLMSESAREVVAGAIVRSGRLLLAQRVSPPEFVGMWELPGGKVELGESPGHALVRELREELGVDVRVHERVGVDVWLTECLVLRAYRAELLVGEPIPHEHSAVAWVRAEELASYSLVPNDEKWVPDLIRLLAPS
ncbi:MAG: (deoxy)nucleoside triphosphate pyrophosphohydrolase [Nocardiaceae bacterium]|nr:(deoxy)nucleoside triphosphate pyrophosphohydrolase [Nocardiaceae bacterium]